MKKSLIYFSTIFLCINIAFTGNSVFAIAKPKEVIFILDSTSAKMNDTIFLDSLKFSRLNTFITDSLDYTKELAALKSDLSEKADNKNTVLFNLTWNMIIRLILAIIIIAIAILFFYDKSKRRDEIIKTITGIARNNIGGISRIKQWEGRLVDKIIAASKPENTQSFGATVPANSTEIKRTIEDLQQRIASLEDQIKSRNTSNLNQNEEIKHVTGSTSIIETLYSVAIVNGLFNKVTMQPNDDTVYELLLKKGSNKSAKFTIYKNAYKRVLKNADFIDGCEKQRISNPPSDLHIEKGEAMLMDNGKWQITQKAIVKLV